MKILTNGLSIAGKVPSDPRNFLIIDLTPDYARELIRLVESVAAIAKMQGYRGGKIDHLCFVDTYAKWTSESAVVSHPRTPVPDLSKLERAIPSENRTPTIGDWWTGILPEAYYMPYHNMNVGLQRVHVYEDGVSYACCADREGDHSVEIMTTRLPMELLRRIAAQQVAAAAV